MIFTRRDTFFLFFIALFLIPISKSEAKFFKIDDYNRFGPLPVQTQNPLYLHFAMSTLETAVPLKKGTKSLAIETTFANLFEHRLLATETLDLDMEFLRTTVEGRYGLTRNLEVGVEMPFLSFSGGFMDSFVQGFHDAFGFPNGGRENVANDRFSYRITRGGATLYSPSQASFYPGDMRLISKFLFLKEGKGSPALALKTVLELPTGRSSLGTGNNRPDIAVSLLAEKHYKRFHFYGQTGFMVNGGEAALSPILKKGGAFFSQAVELNLFKYASLVGQIDIVSPLFKNTALDELNQPVIDLTFGFTGEVPLKDKKKTIFYRASFTEDVTGSGPSVDFALMFKTGLKF